MGRGLLLYIVVERLAMLDTYILTVPALFLFILTFGWGCRTNKWLTRNFLGVTICSFL